MTELSDKRFVHLFSTPIVEHRWPDVDSLNAELRKIVLAREKDDKGEVRSNAGGWHSQGDFDVGRARLASSSFSASASRSITPPRSTIATTR